MRIAIVDDIARERTQLRTWLLGQFSRRGMELTTVEFENGQDFLAQARQEPFSAAFLDIYMTGATGMECARLLREFDSRCQLIFTTTSTDHALEGFQVRALHYLVKPFTEDALDHLTDELLSRIPHPDKYMELKVGGSDIRLSFQNIVYAEHFAHMIYIHTTAGKTLATRLSFKSFIEPLRTEPCFFVCGRGSIINLEHAVDFADAAFLMDDGNQVFVSQEQLKSARQTFMEYLLQRREL